MSVKLDHIWAVVPVKGFREGKSRLAAILTSAQRHELCRSMFCDVLATLQRVKSLAGVLVVTSDREASDAATSLGAVVCVESEPSNLNQAIHLAQSALVSRAAGAMIIVPADIPTLRVSDLRTVIKHLAKTPLVLAPASCDGGTNILAMAPPELMESFFGNDSFDRHYQTAVAAGISHTVCHLPSAARDIDRPADLQELVSVAADSQTGKTIRSWSPADFKRFARNPTSSRSRR